MSYIGKEPQIGNFQKCDSISVVNGQATYGLTVNSVAVFPESSNHVLCSLNGILQAPTDSFTISSSNIVFASNLATGDVIDFVMILGSVLDLGVPSDNTVSASKLTNDIISGQTALTSEPADTDEFLVSDAGTIKRIDYSLIKGGGKLLQVVQSVSTASFSTSSTSYVTVTGTNNSVSITPSSTSSKILISVTFMARNETAGSVADFTIFRDSTNLSSNQFGLEDKRDDSTFNLHFLDSPNTLSQVTYKIGTKTSNSSHPSQINRNSGEIVYIAQEIGA